MPEVPSSGPITFYTTITPGLAAIKKYWRPFLLLQSLALLLVVGYFTSDKVAVFCKRMSDFRNHAGWIFIAISAAFSGALLPELAKTIMLGDRTVNRQRIRNIAFTIAIFGLNGVLTDFQYRGIAWIFGNDNRFGTIIKKALFDQFVTTPLLGTPYWLIVYSLRTNRYDPMATARQISWQWYVRDVLPVLITGWALWLPMVLMIYSLPGPLQFFLFCFVLAAWSLLMVFVATNQADAEMSTPAA